MFDEKTLKAVVDKQHVAVRWLKDEEHWLIYDSMIQNAQTSKSNVAKIFNPLKESLDDFSVKGVFRLEVGFIRNADS